MTSCPCQTVFFHAGKAIFTWLLYLISVNFTISELTISFVLIADVGNGRGYRGAIQGDVD